MYNGPPRRFHYCCIINNNSNKSVGKVNHFNSLTIEHTLRIVLFLEPQRQRTPERKDGCVGRKGPVSERDDGHQRRQTDRQTAGSARKHPERRAEGIGGERLISKTVTFV